ncbi:MAG: hypothetical protein OXT65_05910 [Alphaproteobacteria bacterium]|nr:hypothetical protein [Alphaproteobacteria bacterium]
MAFDKNRLVQSRKLSPQFKSAVMGLPHSADPDKPTFDAFIYVKLPTDAPMKVEGVQNIIGKANIRTAHGISLNGLQRLADNKDVTYIDSGQRLRPLSPSQ